MATIFAPIPDQLYRHAEPQAGTVYPRSRYRRREEFEADWSYVTSPAASVTAVVAALTQNARDVDDRTWTAVLNVHVPAAMQLLTAHGYTFRDFNEGRIPGNSPVCDQFARLVNTTLGGYQVFSTGLAAALIDSITNTLNMPLDVADPAAVEPSQPQVAEVSLAGLIGARITGRHDVASAGDVEALGADVLDLEDLQSVARLIAGFAERIPYTSGDEAWGRTPREDWMRANGLSGPAIGWIRAVAGWTGR